jgi:hypothetical protein
LAAAQPSFGSRDGHAFAGAHPEQVDFDSANVARMLKNILPMGSVGSDLSAEGELDPACGEVVADSAGVGDRADEPVEFRDDEGVAGTDGGEGLVQAGTLAVGAGESVVVEVNPIVGHAEFAQPVALRGEVLLIGRTAGVTYSAVVVLPAPNVPLSHTITP